MFVMNLSKVCICTVNKKGFARQINNVYILAVCKENWMLNRKENNISFIVFPLNPYVELCFP